MNCCDASGRCTNGPDCAARQSAIRFAPGVIEHHRRPAIGTREQRRELRRWIGYLAASAVACLAAIGAGLLVGLLMETARGL